MEKSGGRKVNPKYDGILGRGLLGLPSAPRKDRGGGKKNDTRKQQKPFHDEPPYCDISINLLNLSI
jgi:hypothetical protein